jgi:hypothetical protein
LRGWSVKGDIAYSYQNRRCPLSSFHSAMGFAMPLPLATQSGGLQRNPPARPPVSRPVS